MDSRRQLRVTGVRRAVPRRRTAGAVPLPASRPVAGAAQVGESALLQLLVARYGETTTLAGRVTHRCAWAAHVPITTGLRPQRVADFIAMDLWRDTGAGPALHGHEVKVSRADFLAELRQPDKAGAFLPFLDHWWLVVPDRAIVRDDLPSGWGLMVAHGTTLRVEVPAPRRAAQPIPPGLLAALLRAVQREGVRHAASGCPCAR